MISRVIKEEKSPNKSIVVEIFNNIQFNDLINVKQECEIHITDFAKTINLEPKIYDVFSFDHIKSEPEIEIIHELEELPDLDQQSKYDSKLKVHEIYANFQRLNPSEWQENVIHKITKSDHKFTCEFCDKSFRNSNGLIRHIGRFHKDVKKPSNLLCDLCGKSFKDKSKILVHMRVHKALVQCEICGKSLIPACMRTHMNQVHGKNPQFKCPLCFKIYNSELKFKQHSKTHVKKFECKLCEQQFSASYRYKQHMMWHQNASAFSCSICNKGFIRNSNLKDHMRIHNKDAEKKFQCEKCNFSTLYKKRLKYHIDSHEKQEKRERELAKSKTSVRCNICKAILIHKNSLKNHMNAVHPVEVYKCDLCGAALKSKGIIKRHMKRMHIKV